MFDSISSEVRIFPPWPELNALRSPLTDGERALAQFLDDNLPQDWRIYVQPYVNNMRPDVVVVNPNIGLVVFEVKDWDLSRYHFKNDKLVATTVNNTWIEEDPVKKAQWYAKSLFEQFLVSDEALLPVGSYPNSRSISRAAVYFHCSSTASVYALYKSRAKDVIKAGRDSLSILTLGHLVPNFRFAKSKFIRDAQITALDNIHSWLAPPKHAISQTRTTQLVKGQARYAKPGKGCHRIRGAAGAGKSFVLSHRAARASAEGRKIAVLCFNITMSHILRDLLKQAPYDVNWENVTWMHFHAFVIGLGIDAGIIVSNANNDDDDLDSGSSQAPSEKSSIIDPVSVLKQIYAGKHTPDFKAPTFGGIYIDEGQDFDPQWIDVLAPMLGQGGELVLFADHRQNIYGRDGGCDRAETLQHCRFRKWAQLPRKSFRIPERIALFLNDFSAKVGLGDEEDLPIEEFAVPENNGLALEVLAWHNSTSVESALDSMDSAFSALGNPNPGDVVVLMPDHKLGLQAVSQLQGKYHQIVHVFGEGGPDSPESRRRKMAFWMGRGGLKMSTIHSFKGWELDNVILVWPPPEYLKYLNARQQAALFYTGVSRAMRNMIVLNCNRDYDRFSEGWESLKSSPTRLSDIFDDDIHF
ncbi:hypothetical protein ThidrDRAFT_4367 [Thiorhodococcus drewsii AZ1]|uniref:NERD domain-containing protein n=1 Tax=Thiorhodococcus drewsii AZ1 TaxID=765913 RepID=G2E7V4_9GAMM|nr:NERD domain-containing protein [Thiorhodococcus drewsii]EGV27829.1 hypothetical protein ThidrDRAFT_4367 [Thiorhodococcus drewsii AZ1]